MCFKRIKEAEFKRFTLRLGLSTIQNADCILVLQNGRVTEQGTHDELISNGGFYSTLYNSQFN